MALFSRASNGDLVLASHIERTGYCWIWAVYLSRRKRAFRIVPKAERKGQWHHYIPLPFGRTLIISRQDYRRDARHQKIAYQTPPKLRAAIERKNAERGRPLTGREMLDNLRAWLADDTEDQP